MEKRAVNPSPVYLYSLRSALGRNNHELRAFLISWFEPWSARRPKQPSEPSVGLCEGPRERPFGVLCTAEAHRLQWISGPPTGRPALHHRGSACFSSSSSTSSQASSSSSSSSCSIFVRLFPAYLASFSRFVEPLGFMPHDRRRFHAFASGESSESDKSGEKEIGRML